LPAIKSQGKPTVLKTSVLSSLSIMALVAAITDFFAVLKTSSFTNSMFLCFKLNGANSP
jgi:hypothetical protein